MITPARRNAIVSELLVKIAGSVCTAAPKPAAPAMPAKKVLHVKSARSGTSAALLAVASALPSPSSRRRAAIKTKDSQREADLAEWSRMSRAQVRRPITRTNKTGTPTTNRFQSGHTNQGSQMKQADATTAPQADDGMPASAILALVLAGGLGGAGMGASTGLIAGTGAGAVRKRPLVGAGRGLVRGAVTGGGAGVGAGAGAVLGNLAGGAIGQYLGDRSAGANLGARAGLRLGGLAGGLGGWHLGGAMLGEPKDDRDAAVTKAASFIDTLFSVV